ncbi:hypothetical protein MPSEU_000992500 [Mayamaea pseudoterrestris]|nr:hypothetical protein MPSEU_000992500 [Mayamaea pseudoterrestris]
MEAHSRFTMALQTDSSTNTSVNCFMNVEDEVEEHDNEQQESVPLVSPLSPENDKSFKSSSWITEGQRRIRSHQVQSTIQRLTFMAAMGGFLFGYDTGVISGALLPMQRRFQWKTNWEPQMIVSSTVLAAAVGAIGIGRVTATKYGRRRTIVWSAGIIGIGSIILSCAIDFWTLIIGRLIVGIGIGMASLTTPIYIAEVAPPKMRGQLVTVNALLVTFGQFGAGMVDGIFEEWMPNTGGWRWMLGLAIVPACVMLYGFITLPESPRWLAMVGQTEEAANVLKTVRDSDDDANAELVEILQSVTTLARIRENDGTTVDRDNVHPENVAPEHDYGTARLSLSSASHNDHIQNESFHQRLAIILADAPTRRALVLGCGLMVIQQLSGINTVMYFAATIYRMTGFDDTTSVWLSGFTALAQVVGIAISIMLVDRLGRRELVLGSLGAVSVSLMGLGLTFYWTRVSSELVTKSEGNCGYQPSFVWSGVTKYCYDCTSINGCGFCGGRCAPGDEQAPFSIDTCPAESDWQYDLCSNQHGWWSALFMVAYLLSFGIGMGGLPWTINSEIYHLKHRSLCVSVSTAVNWVCNLLVAATFLSLSSPSVLTIYGAFWMYGCVASAGFAWLYFALPETKGLHLEEIERLFQRDADQYNAIDNDEHEH